jgi:Bacterial Ig-like domain (group 3)/FG-GAP-like repeat
VRSRSTVVAVALLVVILAGFPRAAAATQDNFYSIPVYPAGFTPVAAALGDFNGDGKLDIATANINGGDVSILLNNGDGTFGAAVDYPSGGYLTSSLAVGDFNHDGKLDLALANGGTTQENDQNLAILLGNGDGTFQPAVTYVVQAGTNFVASGDFNGDGNLDVVVTNATADSLSVLLGNGDGTFGKATNYTVGPNLSWIAVGDLNGDGRPDLVVAQSSSMSTNELSVFLNNGSGVFQAGWTYQTSVTMGSIGLADFNGDGKLDLLVADYYQQATFTLFPGMGNGTFGNPVLHNIGFPSYSIAVQDVNGDGNPDLVCSTEPGFSVVLGNGNGTFKPAVSYGGSGQGALVSGDLGASGQTGVVETEFNAVAVVLADANGNFIAPTAYPLKQTGGGFAVAGDFNNDGKLDITDGDGTLLGNGDGTFRQGPAYVSGTDPTAAVAADFNGDGKLDLAVADQASDQGLKVLMGNGNGTFQTAVPYNVGALTVSVADADFNHDGFLDLVVANAAPKSSTLSVLLGNGNGTFGTAVNYKVAEDPVSVGIGDFNGDGNPDLAVVSSNSTTLSILLGNGNGTFQSPSTMPLSLGNPYALTVVDLNGDGKLDLVIGSAVSGTIVLLGNGNGTFKQSSTQTGGGGTYAVTADFNGDGLPDVAMSSIDYPNGNLSVMLGEGTGTLQTAVTYPIGAYAYPLAVADFNGDGAPDVAVPSNGLSETSIVVELNLGGTFVTLTSSDNPSQLGQPVTFTATVAASLPDRPQPTGSVTFKDGTKALGTLPLMSGTAMFTTSHLTAGTHSITATYSGDTNFNRHVSAPLGQKVESQ